MAITSNSFNLSIYFSETDKTFKVYDNTDYVSQEPAWSSLNGKAYAILTSPQGLVVFNRDNNAVPFIDNITYIGNNSQAFSIPTDQDGNILLGDYELYYRIRYEDPENPGEYIEVEKDYFTLSLASFTHIKPVLEVTSDASYGPNGLLTATVKTQSVDNTNENPNLTLYYPSGLTPAIDPIYSDNTITNVNYVATGTWTCLLSHYCVYTLMANIDNTTTCVYVTYRAQINVLHTVSDNDSLCNVNTCIDDVVASFTQAINSASNPSNYLNQLTLINSYYTQMQIEQSCGNGNKAQEYANKILDIAGVANSCSCGSGCGGDCGDIVPHIIDNTSGEAGGYKSLVLSFLPNGENDPNSINVFYNTIGNFDLQYYDIDQYAMIFYNVTIPVNKLFVSLLGGTDQANAYYLDNSGNNPAIYLTTAAAVSANPTSVEIRIYN
jgi:hypothetical protein